MGGLAVEMMLRLKDAVQPQLASNAERIRFRISGTGRDGPRDREDRVQRSTSKRPWIVWLSATALFLAMAPLGRGQARASAAVLASEKALGSKEAPITMEVFTDYQCPACRGFYEMTLRPVIDNYVAAGKVYLVQHDFPLPMHAYSREAARWANAAAEIGRFEVVEQALYAKQDQWGTTGKIEPVVAGVLSPAEMRKVREILQARGRQIDAAINRDVNLALQRRVNQTPTIFVTHRGQTTPLPPGGVSYALLKQYLDMLLRQ